MNQDIRCLALSMFTIVSCLLASSAARATPIVLDGGFDDWSSVAVSITDTGGDAGGSGVDFDRVWTTNDDRYFFMRFETTAEVQGDEQQSLRLYLDTDMNAQTGTSYDGIGADLVWDFGQRSGSFRGSNISHDDIGLLLAPTVSNTEFEIALRLDATPSGSTPLFPGSQVRFILRDTSGGGDRVPDAGATTATIASVPNDDPNLPLTRNDAAHVRVTSYNIKNDGLADGGSREDALGRILNAIDADVWVLNEVWDSSATQTRDRIETLLGESGWSAVKLDQGNVIASRFPILDSWEVLPGSRLTAALIDLSVPTGQDLLVIACHLSCCTADTQRQEQADALISFIRDAMTPGGRIDLPADTPIVAAGDFNLVGWRQQLDTILTGDIQNQGTFGADFAPDWDGSSFDLPLTTHTDQRVGYTWRNDFSSFYPGLLDFVFYTGSVVDLGNHYILDTRTMRATTLNTYGLQVGDTEAGSDHCPRVADFVFEPAVSAPLARHFTLHENVPNPFNPRTTLSFDLERSAHVTLDVLDVSGRRVRTLVNGTRSAGRHDVIWNGRDAAGRAVSGGVYLVRLRSDDEIATTKISLVK